MSETAPATVEHTRQAGVPARRARVLLCAKLAVSLGLIAWLLSGVPIRNIFATVATADFRLILLASLAPYLGGYFTATRWGGLLRALGVSLPGRYLFQSCVVAAFFRQFLPSTIGGDAIRAFDTWKGGASKSVALAALAVDRLVGLLVLLLFAVAAVTLSHELTQRHPSLFAWLTLGVVSLGLVTWLIFAPSSRFNRLAGRLLWLLPRIVARPLDKFATALAVYRGKSRQLTTAVFWSVLLQANVVTYDYLIATSLGCEIPYYAFFLITPLVIFITLMPVSINGIGVRETCYVLLFQAYAVSESRALAFALIHYGLLLLYAFVGGVLYALRKQTRLDPVLNTTKAIQR